MKLQQWQKQAGKGAAIFTCASRKVAMTSGKLVPIHHLYWDKYFCPGKIFLYWDKYCCTGINIFTVEKYFCTGINIVVLDKYFCIGMNMFVLG